MCARIAGLESGSDGCGADGDDREDGRELDDHSRMPEGAPQGGRTDDEETPNPRAEQR